jgi:hypothetical protein
MENKTVDDKNEHRNNQHHQNRLQDDNKVDEISKAKDLSDISPSLLATNKNGLPF